MTLSVYLPQDRLRALARGETLPDRTTGAALFADISGFTPLTEVFRISLGPRRGAEKLTQLLDTVFAALIGEVEKYGGSVIDFAGDAITCWFDNAHDPAALRAVACALALQRAMQAFRTIPLPNGTTTALTWKVAVATGPARRFVVGDPTIHYVDVLAGATVTRTATAEHLAQKGEVLLDEATVNILGAALSVREWRTDAESGERFAVITSLATGTPFTSDRIGNVLADAIAPVVPEPAPVFEAAALRPWLNQTVYEREQSGQGAFLTEFRPCVALFARFVGIDYDADEAETQLDALIRQVQALVARYEGDVLQITIGDKGSYLYLNFGALSSHEDDARRAVKTALELRAAASHLGFLAPLQMGLTQGAFLVGANDGPTRRIFGAMGDDVNLAARLMQTAAPGEILLSGQVQKAVADHFVCEPRPALALKGKAEPVAAFAVTGERQARAIRLQEPHYALPMVGRQAELQTISDRLDAALQGQAQIISLVAEAGLGKSRLVAEVIRLARRKGFTGYGGACQSDSVNTPYLVWKAIWSAFFDVDPSAPLHKQIRLLEGEMEDRAPARRQALPLLGPLLNLSIPDNEFTQALEPKFRKSALHALLEDCLKAAAKEEPILLVFEDMHWIDALSHDLLEELAQTTTTRPICFVLAYRPPQLKRLQATRLEALPSFTKIELRELDAAECEQAIHAKLAQLYPARRGAVPPQLVENLTVRTQGNPFYLEELLNYLRDRGLDPRDPTALDKIELPDSLHTLILSRIDQLTEREKNTLRVASIVGRLFRAAWLPGYYPALGELARVKADLDQLNDLDITPLDTPEPELAYLFKHIVTHEVTYESLPFATRAQLHEQLAQFIESQPDKFLDLLAFHYGLSANVDKQREYFRKAGEAAKAAYANDAALEYYTRLLPLLNEPAEQVDLHLQWGAVLELLGRYDEAGMHYQGALTLAAQDPTRTARCQLALGKLCRLRGDHPAAFAWLEQARHGWAALQDGAVGLGQALIVTGQMFSRQSEYATAHQHLEEGLALAREGNDRLTMALALNTLAVVAQRQGDYAAARALYDESLTLWHKMGDKPGIAASLNNLGIVALDQGDYAAARALYDESLALRREIGDKSGIAMSLNNLGIVALNQGDNVTARALYEESLALRREIGDKYGIATSLNNLGTVALIQGDYAAAGTLCEESLALYRETGNKRGAAYALHNFGDVAFAQANYETAQKYYRESLTLKHAIGDKWALTYDCLGLAAVAGLTSSSHASDQRVARLAAATETLLKALKAQIEPFVRRLYDPVVDAVRIRLGEEAFNAAWAKGQALTMEEAIALAVEKP